MASNPNIVNGLQPNQRLDTAAWRNSLRVYYSPASNASALYLGDPVIKVAASADVNGINGAVLASAGASNKITGVVCGFLGSCTAGTGLSNASFYGQTPGPLYQPASSAKDWYLLVNDDPDTEWVIQSDNNYGGVAGTPVPVAAVGKNINLVAGAGSVLGWSGWYANSDSIATTNTYQLNIIGLYTDPVNLAGNLYQKLIVRLNTATELLQNSTGI
jgi:hypothetical protein